MPPRKTKAKFNKKKYNFRLKPSQNEVFKKSSITKTMKRDEISIIKQTLSNQRL